MNRVVIMGRLTKDPEISYTTSQKSVCKFTVACDRTGEGADYINCVAWEKKAEFVSKFFQKGKPIAIIGSIRTGSYQRKDGTKAYTTDVLVENVEFVPGDKKDEPVKTDDFGAFQAVDDGMPF